MELIHMAELYFGPIRRGNIGFLGMTPHLPFTLATKLGILWEACVYDWFDCPAMTRCSTATVWKATRHDPSTCSLVRLIGSWISFTNDGVCMTLSAIEEVSMLFGLHTSPPPCEQINQGVCGCIHGGYGIVFSLPTSSDPFSDSLLSNTMHPISVASLLEWTFLLYNTTIPLEEHIYHNFKGMFLEDLTGKKHWRIKILDF